MEVCPRGLAFAPNGSLYVAEAGVGGSGPSDVSFQASGGMYVTIGLGADPGHKSVLPPEGQLAATVVKAKPPQGTVKLAADIGGYELTANASHGRSWVATGGDERRSARPSHPPTCSAG
jgi:hypothetical protein